MTEANNPESRIAVAHDDLTAKLIELRRRETHVRTVLSPLRHLANPWVHVAIAGAVGYRLGRPRQPALPVLATAPSPAGSETVIQAVVRASLIAIAQAVVRNAVAAFLPHEAVRS